MTKITLRQLRYFEALAQHRHFGVASNACSVTQPALSMQIRDFELALGVNLFEKGTHPVQLTPLGRIIAAKSKAIMLDVAELEELVRASDNQPLINLRLGVIPTVAPYIFSRIAKDLTMHFTGLNLKMREAITSKLITAVIDGELDAAIIALPASEPRLRELELFRENFLLVRPKADAKKPVPRPEMLKEMRLLLLEEGHCFRDQALTFCKMGSSNTQDVMDGNSLTTLVQMVAAGFGVTLIPEMAAEFEGRIPNISIAKFHKNPPKRKIGMVWRRNSPLQDKYIEIAQIVKASQS
ncbi:MAG: hydrogen peroxide-inducible genes activator [Paracoccaceae bacterium]|tara:strand:+ start:34 stop:921 length:888 start_codon:yes stop_codon:yes gene_type:complete